MRIDGYAQPEQIAGPKYRFQRALRRKFFAAHEAGIGSSLHAGLAEHRHRESVSILRDRLNRISPENLAQHNDGVRQVGVRYMNVGPKRLDDLPPKDQTAVVAHQQMHGVEDLRREK